MSLGEQVQGPLVYVSGLLGAVQPWGNRQVKYEDRASSRGRPSEQSAKKDTEIISEQTGKLDRPSWKAR